ncbi:MAG: ROK family protein [Deltaproteobacteria bacterium]|nr:ROK family protein [Deltaproteobacteria bacterium]MBW2448098.1 ROK family protein [Deltaproteobacteria bacterium]
MEPISDPVRAERLARALVSDLMIYDPEKVRVGIRQDDLFERLTDEIARARKHFQERVDPELAGKQNVFDRALVDVLVYRSRDVSSRIW